MGAARWVIFPKPGGKYDVTLAGDPPPELAAIDHDDGFASSGEARRAIRLAIRVLGSLPISVEAVEPEDRG